MTIRLAFHGAASTVTGSCYLVEHERGRFLVDCGLFQGTKTIRELNYGRFPFAVQGVDHVLLTHAHTDHAGLLPKLRKAGFQGPIHATEPTIDLLRSFSRWTSNSWMWPLSGSMNFSRSSVGSVA